MMKLSTAVAICLSSIASPAIADDRYQDLFELSLNQLSELQISDVKTQAAKWSSNAFDLPFSISFLTPHDYYSPFLNSIQDTAHQISSLTVTEYNKVTPQLYIRGIGSNSSGAGDDPSVAYLVNGVNISRPGFHNPILFDIQRVEVIKGPQGSLYGKGVIGGAVNMVPNVPNDATYTKLIGTAKENGWDLRAIDNSVINEHAKNRLSIVSEDIDGYVTNHGTGHDLGEETNLAVREQLAWDDGKNSLHLLLEYNTMERLDPAYSYHGDTPLTTLAATNLSPYRNKDYDVTMPIDSRSERDFYFLSLEYDMENKYGRWVSITSLNKGEYDFNMAFLPINFNTSVNQGNEKAWQANQELRFEKQQQALKWNLGIYLSREKIERIETFDFTGLVNLFGLGAVLTPDTPGSTTSVAEETVVNSALFFNSEWEFTKDWKLNLGLRSDYVKKDFDLAVTGGDPFNIGLMNSEDFSISTDKNWRETSYAISLSRYINETVMIYGRLATGFKAGSFNSLAPSETSALAASKSEKALNKELGIKGFYFDKHLQVDVALFSIDYDDLQVFSGTESEANAPEAKISGFEWETRARLKKGFEISANYAYLDTKFLKFVSPDGTNLADKDLPRTPQHALSISIQRLWNDNRDNQYWAEWQSMYTDEIGITPKAIEGSKIPSYHVSNFALSIKPTTSQAQYTLWVKNIFNKAYSTHAVAQQDFLYTNEGSARNMAPPRTIGATLNWSLR